MSKENLIELTTNNFDQYITNNPNPVVVDFWAAWCGPCRAFAPMFEETATSYAGKVQFAKLNVDDHQEIAARFAVRSIPTVLLFKNGKVVGTKVGVPSKADFTNFIDSHV